VSYLTQRYLIPILKLVNEGKEPFGDEEIPVVSTLPKIVILSILSVITRQYGIIISRITHLGILYQIDNIAKSNNE